MVDQDISVTETVIVEESLQFLTPPPKVYSDAKDEVLALRNNIMQDLVAGRVKALLDAGHDSMNKYRERIDKLGVTTYLFGDLRRKAMVIRLKGYDLGEGIYRYAKTEYDAPQANYPLMPPYAVPQRPLPQVDVFSFAPYTSVTIKEMHGGAQLQGIITIQVPSGSMAESPDAENALYDYYFLYPQAQYKGKYIPLEPVLYGIEYWRASQTYCNRMLHLTSDLTEFYIVLSVFFDAVVHLTADADDVIAFIAWFGQNPLSPVITIRIGEYRIETGGRGFWSTFKAVMPFHGFSRFSDGLLSVEESATLWINHFTVTLSVNNPEWGYTSPVEGEYEKKAGYLFSVTAVPEGGHVFDHWELDGVNIGDDNPYELYPLKPCELKAIFT